MIEKKDYEKNNVCSFCKGEIYFPSFKGRQRVKCTCEDGTKVGQLKFELLMEKKQSQRNLRDYKLLKDYIEKTSTCKTCGGKQGKTFLGFVCKECGLPGSEFLPG